MNVNNMVMLLCTIIIGIIFILTIIFALLLKYKGKTAVAVIVNVEEKMKYHDSSSHQWLAYDYIFEFEDDELTKHTGKLLRNSPEKEFQKGDVVQVLYLPFYPKIVFEHNLLLRMKWFPYILGVMTLIMFLLCYLV